jgi:hypothetical protein
MMPLDFVQDGLVTLAALAAGALVFRRVFAFVRPGAKPGCANCPSGSAVCAPPARETARDSDTHPLVLVQPSRR